MSTSGVDESGTPWKSPRDASAALAALIESASDPIWAVDLDYRLVTFNPAFARQIAQSYGVQVAVGMQPHDIFPSEDTCLWLSRYQRVLSGDRFIDEFELPNGRIMELTCNPIRQYGKITGISVFGKDITERKNAEAALQNAESMYRAVFTGAVQGIFRFGPDRRLVAANPALAKILGYDSPEEAICMLTPDRFWADPGAELQLARLVAREETVHGYECRVLRKDGTSIWVSLSSRRIYGDDGKMTYYQGFLEDITERKRLEEQLREAQKMDAMGKLAGGIAHDFNNLITIVTGYGNLLRNSLGENPSAQEMLEQILKASEQASSLTRQLLAFARRQRIQPRVLDLGEIVGHMVGMLRRVVSEEIELNLLSGPDPLPIRADQGQIEQVIMNLVINARDATPRGGRITLSTDEPTPEESGALPWSTRPCVRLMVSDTGVGMDAETRARIFEPFFTTKELGKGTGLGLATVYGIVKQAGGHITVESEPGAGTRFVIFFPRAEGVIAINESDRQPVPERGSETILLVEDQDGLRSLMCDILGRSGYSVLSARNGRDALQLAADHRELIDLVITDLVMPELGGREVAERLPAFHPESRVLYMSGYTENTDELSGNECAFIDKPFSPEELLRKVRQVLDTTVDQQRNTRAS